MYWLMGHACWTYPVDSLRLVNIASTCKEYRDNIALNKHHEVRQDMRAHHA